MSLVSGISLKELAQKIGADLEGDPDKEVIGLIDKSKTNRFNWYAHNNHQI